MRNLKRTLNIIILAISLITGSEIFAQEINKDLEKTKIDSIGKIINEGNFNEAIVQINNRLEAEPQNTDLLNLLGDLYNYMSLYSDALRMYKESYKIDSNNNALFGEAIVNFFTGNLLESKRQFSLLIKSNFRLMDSYNFMGKIELLNDDLAEAENYFNKVYSIDSTNVEAITNLGIIYQQLKMNARAEIFLRMAVELSPDDYSFLNLGVFYGMTNRFNEAVITLNKAISINPKNKKVYHALGVMYLNKGIFPEAEKHFYKELELDAYNNEAYLNLILLYTHKSEFKKAINTFEKMQILGLSHPQLFIAISNIYFKQNQFDKALEYAQMQVNAYPDKIDSYLTLMGIYKFMGLNKEYDELFEKIKTHVPLSENNDLNKYPENITNSLRKENK